MACSLCCEFSRILKEIVTQFEFGREYVHYCRSSEILRTLMSLMGEMMQCSVSNFQWERSDGNGIIS